MVVTKGESKTSISRLLFVSEAAGVADMVRPSAMWRGQLMLTKKQQQQQQQRQGSSGGSRSSSREQIK